MFGWRRVQLGGWGGCAWSHSGEAKKAQRYSNGERYLGGRQTASGPASREATAAREVGEGRIGWVGAGRKEGARTAYELRDEQPATQTGFELPLCDTAAN